MCLEGLPCLSNASILICMEQRGTSRGLKKCRKFANLANSVRTALVVSAALAWDYCNLDHWRNGRLVLVNG
jgi:hypothetical protein